MLKRFIKYILIVLAISIVSCAKRGSITGGSKDTLAPELRFSTPENRTVNFKDTEIKLYFDEYVKLKNVGKQLIVSPPMSKAPEVLPYNSSKYIIVKFKDTLQKNTTYSLNFGQSIQDNNEGNIFSQFKYVFSTGPTIDSLSLSATFNDAFDLKRPNFVSFMLYEVNEKYTDSIIYKETPRYITNSLDSLKLVKLENLKQGKYRLVAIQDKNNNNKFDPKTDKIGFKKDFVTLPNDTIYELNLFKEDIPFKANKPSQSTGNKAIFGYEGNPKDVKIDVKKGDEPVVFKVSKFPKKDSLQIWFKPIKNDSITIAISKDNFNQKFTLKLKDQKKDTLSFTPEKNGILAFRDKFKINTTIPIEKIDNSKIKFIRKDSTLVSFTTSYDDFNQQVVFDFEKQPLEKYSIQLLPGALIDFYDKQNDTLKYKFDTRNTSNYGNLRVILENVKRYPVIIELTDKEGKVLASEIKTDASKGTTVEFNLLEANVFTLRAIYDTNKDGLWTPGNYLKKQQSEEIIYFKESVRVNENWDVEQPFNLKK